MTHVVRARVTAWRACGHRDGARAVVGTTRSSGQRMLSCHPVHGTYVGMWVSMCVFVRNCGVTVGRCAYGFARKIIVWGRSLSNALQRTHTNERTNEQRTLTHQGEQIRRSASYCASTICQWISLQDFLAPLIVCIEVGRRFFFKGRGRDEVARLDDEC